MNRLTLAQAAALTPSKLAALSSQDLFHLQTEANDALTSAKAVADVDVDARIIGEWNEDGGVVYEIM